MNRILLLCACVVASTACRSASRVPGEPPDGTAEMRSASGAAHGALRIDRDGSGVRIRGTLTGLTPGPHGIHFHQVGRCDSPDFTTAGAHVNPTGALHGLQNPLGPHAGDLPNITANAAGEATVDLGSTRVTADAGSPRSLFDADGTALVVHAAADDQRADPAGNSGDRVVCGVVTRAQ
jgi:Cu-Zn family superoxide dismutase